MQEADLTGCSSDSANDEEQHEGNVTLRGILQSSTSSLPPLLHPPSLPEESVLFKPISSAQFPLLTSALLPRLPNHRQAGCKFTYKARRADGGSTCVIFITYVSVMKKGSFLLVSTFKKVSWLVRSKKVLQAVHLLWIFPNGQNQKYQIVRNQSLPVLWKVCIFAIPVHIPWTDLRIFLPLLPWSVCGSGS